MLVVSNAWFLYVGPLIVATVFIAAGSFMTRQAVCGGVDARGRRHSRAGVFGIVFVLVGGWVAAKMLSSPPPWKRQALFDRVFRTPMDQIERFVIRHDPNDEELTLIGGREVVIDDRERIGRIAEILSAGKEAWLNHPRTKWIATVEMVTQDGDFYFEVTATQPGDSNGTFVSPWMNADEHGQDHLGEVRADGLEKILEESVKGATTR